MAIQRLIDANALQKTYNDECIQECAVCIHHYHVGKMQKCRLIDMAPTVAPIPSVAFVDTLASDPLPDPKTDDGERQITFDDLLKEGNDEI